MTTYYHATYIDLVDKIQQNGLKSGWEGGVYLCASADDAISMMGWRLLTRVDFQKQMELDKAFKAGEDPTAAIDRIGNPIQQFKTFIVVEVEVDENNVEVSHDHSRAFIDVDAYFHRGDITSSSITEIIEYEYMETE